ncbi:hypothetical protein N7508_009083 [Penicillium antarcticum]|uniref:uncharacterized protein n=1 Tax=Penicillium antarcticum TaxID=416450 RepID=UPI00238B4247|nr:uncharacterized protein N7508_009083 [Penicillium antarcticum]KAJ5294262.1 hypothetical protein N7508_009083 [Penicillium antarcticum]
MNSPDTLSYESDTPSEGRTPTPKIPSTPPPQSKTTPPNPTITRKPPTSPRPRNMATTTAQIKIDTGIPASPETWGERYLRNTQ